MKLIWSIIPVVLFGVIGIQQSFAEETLDFETCEGFLSADEVKSAIGYNDDITVESRDATPYAQEDDPSVLTLCTMTFQSTDGGLVMMVGTFRTYHIIALPIIPKNHWNY